MPATQEKDIFTARSHALAWLLMTQRSPGKKRKGWCIFICREAANEKAALSKTVSRFWTIPLLRVLNLVYLAALRFKTFLVFCDSISGVSY